MSFTDMNPARTLRHRLQRSTDYKTVFGSDAGKRVYADLAKFCHFDSPTFVPGDPNTGAFNEGLRRAFLRIRGFVKMDDAELERLIADEAMREKGVRRDGDTITE